MRFLLRSIDLRDIRLAYLAGDLATSRAILLGNALSILEDDTRQSAQASALALGARPTPDATLRHQLDRLIVGIDLERTRRYAYRHLPTLLRG